MKKQKKIWFKAKQYGWGWYPCTWQGWGVLFAWVILFILSIKQMDPEFPYNLISIFIFTAVLIYICYKKGEKPAWHWGNK
jgi:hypothetical protein